MFKFGYLKTFLILTSLKLTYAAVSEYNCLTWNICGACTTIFDGTQTQESSIQKAVNVMKNQNIDVLAIQEAGSLSYFMDPNRFESIPVTNGYDDPRIFRFKYNVGTQSRPKNYDIYFLETKPDNQRTNMALITRPDRVNEVLAFSRDGALAHERPAFGIRMGNDFFFNIHAASRSGGADAPFLVRDIHNYMNDRGFASWIIMGDFNRDSRSLMNRLTQFSPETANAITTISQSRPTQTSGGVLDYAIVPNDVNMRAHFVVEQRGGVARHSDHYPINFNCRNY